MIHFSEIENNKEYARMAGAIADLANSTGTPPIIFSLCEWGWASVSYISYRTHCSLYLLFLESSVDLGKAIRTVLEDDR